MNFCSRFLASALLAVAAFGAGVASATTVTFEDVASGILPLPISSTGFQFTGAGLVGVTPDGSDCGPLCSANGSQRVLIPGSIFGAVAITMSRIDAATFALVALDGAEMFSGIAENDAARIDYVGYLAAMVVTSGFLTLDGINDGPGGVADFQTFGISGVMVDRIVFSGSGGTNGNNAFALDNLVTLDNTVPEPGTLAVVGLGLVGLAAVRRRRPARWALSSGSSA